MKEALTRWSDFGVTLVTLSGLRGPGAIHCLGWEHNAGCLQQGLGKTSMIQLMTRNYLGPWGLLHLYTCNIL